MSWDLQDLGAHLMTHHGYDKFPESMPYTYEDRIQDHDKDHANPIGLGHEHFIHDPRIIKEV